LSEAQFIARCTRCSACIETCPARLIVKGRGGFPEVDFSRNECTFCGDCVKACKDQALVAGGDRAPWPLKAVIAETCLAVRQVVCRTCGEQCETGAICFLLQPGGMAVPLINLETCTGCGACVRVCPAGAVSMIRQIDEALAA
jgi:ferredoxin-type protein NapF